MGCWVLDLQVAKMKEVEAQYHNTAFLSGYKLTNSKISTKTFFFIWCSLYRLMLCMFKSEFSLDNTTHTSTVQPNSVWTIWSTLQLCIRVQFGQYEAHFYCAFEFSLDNMKHTSTVHLSSVWTIWSTLQLCIPTHSQIFCSTVPWGVLPQGKISVCSVVTQSTIIWQDDDLCCANDAKTANNSTWILCSWVCASWINVNNCPTRCDYIQVHYISANGSTCFG